VYPPRNLSYTAQQYYRNNVTLLVEWEPPQCDEGIPFNYQYTITVDRNSNPNLCVVPSNGTTDATNVTLVNLCYNVMYSVSVMVTNRIGSSDAVMVNIAVGMLFSLGESGRQAICMHTCTIYIVVLLLSSTTKIRFLEALKSL